MVGNGTLGLAIEVAGLWINIMFMMYVGTRRES